MMIVIVDQQEISQAVLLLDYIQMKLIHLIDVCSYDTFALVISISLTKERKKKRTSASFDSK